METKRCQQIEGVLPRYPLSYSVTRRGATYTEGSRKRHLGHTPAFCKLSSEISDLESSSSCDTWLTKKLQKQPVSRGREFMANSACGSSRALRSKLVPGRGGGIKLGQLWSTPSGGFREHGLSLLPQNRYNWEGRLGYVSHTHVDHALLSPGTLTFREPRNFVHEEINLDLPLGRFE